MNKTTTLVLAAIAGFGLSAQARTTTNELWTVNFEGVETSQETGIAKLADLDASAMEEAFTDGAWTVQADDDSYVTNVVGATGPNRLELDTQGNDLTWTPTDTGLQGNRSITEMDVRFVAADDAPDGFDSTSVQTAFFVQNIYTNAMGEPEDDPQFLQLYAWTWDTAGSSNHWEAIGAPFAASFADAMHQVQILIDYRHTTLPYLHVAVDGTEVTGEGVVAANKTDTKTTGKMTAVTFKGTGTVDNFTGTRFLTDYAECDFTAEVYMDGEYVAADSKVSHAGAGDSDYPNLKAEFTGLPIDDWGESEPTYALARIMVTNFATGATTTYSYTYDKVNHRIVSENPCPDVTFEQAEDQETHEMYETGLITFTPSTYGATNDSVIAKLYYNTLDAYFAGADVNVGEDSARYEKFVKPAEAGTTVSWTFPNTTNGTYVLRSVVVANGATFDSSTGVVSFEVPEGGIGSDKTYATVTYVEGGYDAEALEWVYDAGTGTWTLQRKTFTVTFTWEGGSSSDTYHYGDTPVVPADPADYVSGGATYGFTGWSPAVVDVVADATYVAQYEMTSAPKATVIRIADGSVESFGSLEDALEAAVAGDTVKLLDNAVVSSTVVVDKDLVFDLGGYYVSNTTVRSGEPFARVFQTDAGNVVVTNGTLYGRVNCYDTANLTIAAETTVEGYVLVWGDGTYGEAGCKTPTLTVDGAINTTGEMFGIMVGNSDTSRPAIAIRDGARIQAENGGVALYNGASLTMSGGSIESPSVGVGVHGGSTFTMTGGSITTGEYGVYNNGLEEVATTIAVSGGTITSTNEVNTACGIYQAGIGSLTISGTAVVSGPDAVEVRAGTVQVLDNARLVATMPYTEPASNGNGNSGHGGVALLVSQHTTAQNVSATVNGGTLQGAVAFQEATVETQNDETKVSGAINAGAILGDVLSEDIDNLIPSDSEALFADADAEGVEEGYRLVEDPENPGLYKVEPIVMHLLETAIALRYNCNTNVTVVDYPEGATFGWTISTNGVVFKPTQGPVPISSGKTTASVKVYAGATPFETATATVAVTNNGVQIGTLSATISLDDVAAVVDGVTYAKADLDAAAAAAIANNKVLGLYVNGPTITLAEGQTLVSQVLSERNNPTPSVKAPAGTAEKVYTVNTAIDNATKTRTYTLTYDTPTVMYTSTDGQTVEYLDAKFKMSKDGTYKLLKDVERAQLTVGNVAAVLDLDGHEFSSTVTGSKGAIYVDSLIGNASLTIRDTAGGGSIVAENCYAIWGNRNATIAIEGGEIVGKADVVYLSNAADTLTITGGTFRMASGSANFMLNMLDSARGSISVTGGSFYGFDPMDNTAEGAHTDFVALTHASVADSPSAGWYTVVPAFTVTWNDEDGTALETDTRVATGVTPSFDGENPAKASTAQYDYAFDAWTPAIAAVESNTVYTATYTETLRTYTITWANYDNTVLHTDEVAYGETPEYAGETPEKPNDGDTEYEFDGWSPAIVPVEGAATYVAQFSAKENGTVIVITDNGATTNYFATLQAALDDVKENNLQQANIELLADASITISKDGNVLGGDAATKITIKGNGNTLNVVRNGTWAQFNTANGAKLVLSDMSLTSEFVGTQTGWVGDTLQNPNHNIAFNCDVELDDVTSTTALSFWKDADLDTVTIAETVDVYSIWIHTTASNIAIKDLVVNSPTGRGIKVDDSFVKYAGAPSASTAISIDGASFTTKNKKAAVLVRSAYPIAITTDGTIDISNVPADTQHLVWVDEDASENFGLVTLDGGQSDLGVEGGASSYAASLTTNAWIAGYYKVLADAVEVATSADTVTLLKENAETFTVSKDLTITRNGFSAENVTAGEGYQRTDTAETYVFAVKATEEHKGAIDGEGFVILDPDDPDNTEDKPLTFTSISPTGTATISAAMLNPKGSASVELQVVYRTSLTGVDQYLRATVSNIDTVNGTATVTWTQPNVDTFFLIGLANKVNVDDP